MAERRFSGVLAALALFVIAAVVWDALPKPRRAPRERLRAPVQDTTPVARPVPASAPPSAPTTTSADSAGAAASQGAAVPPSPAPPPPPPEPGYLDLMARAQTRGRIRASAGATYLNEMFAASGDSMLHRWDNRILRPVRVFLGPDTVANFQPGFLDMVRSAFQRWEATGLPVRFDLTADARTAEVQFRWTPKFAIDRTGQTDLTWDQNGHLRTGTVTLATIDPKGPPLRPDDIRIIALHEIGHLLGLDHAPDSTDIMFPTARVRDLSQRDIQSALLLYQLVPGNFR